MSKTKQINRYLNYFAKAKTKYDIHSPFVFDFVENILEDKRHFYAFSKVETLRNELKTNESEINVLDLGAGSKQNNRNKRKVKDIAKSALSSPWQCKILFRILNHYKPKYMIELGTSLGVSTLYQAMARLDNNFITMEGSPEIAKIARQNFRKIKARNIELLEGNFDTLLKETLDKLPQLDYAFLDGNHREQATIKYFNACLEKSHEDTLLIFDDIHWSEGMENAWQKIINHPSVTLSLDLFHFGIVFFKTDFKEKENFALIESKFKPWSVGFFG